MCFHSPLMHHYNDWLLSAFAQLIPRQLDEEEREKEALTQTEVRKVFAKQYRLNPTLIHLYHSGRSE